jgi:hypothetical protein
MCWSAVPPLGWKAVAERGGGDWVVLARRDHRERKRTCRTDGIDAGVAVVGWELLMVNHIWNGDCEHDGKI